MQSGGPFRGSHVPNTIMTTMDFNGHNSPNPLLVKESSCNFSNTNPTTVMLEVYFELDHMLLFLGFEFFLLISMVSCCFVHDCGHTPLCHVCEATMEVWPICERENAQVAYKKPQPFNIFLLFQQFLNDMRF